MTRNQRIRKTRTDADLEEKPKGGPRPNREQGAWITFLSKRQGLTWEQIAQEAQVSGEMVHMVIYGKRVSSRVQKIIARELGYKSWIDLLASREEVAA